MKFVYYGGTFCEFDTLKRLLVVAREIVFMDRPSIALGKWGTVGIPTAARNIEPLDPKVGVTISAVAPPSGAASRVFHDYVARDLENPHFRERVLKGLSDPRFAARMVQLDGDYQKTTGREIISALIKDDGLRAPKLEITFDDIFKVDSEQGRRNTFAVLLVEASMLVSCGLVGAEEADCSAITDDPTLSDLWSLRISEASYVGTHRRVASLGAEVARAALPDYALAQLSIEDILTYRTKTKDAYDAWLAQVERLVETLESVPVDKVEAVSKRIIQESIKPEILAYKKELESVRDSLFADLFKSIPKWSMPAILLAYLGGASAILSFAGAATGAGVDAAVNYFKAKRGARRNHAVSYLLDLVEGKTLSGG